MASDVKLIWEGAICEMDKARLWASRVSNSSDLLFQITTFCINVLLARPGTPLSMLHNSHLMKHSWTCHGKEAILETWRAGFSAGLTKRNLRNGLSSKHRILTAAVIFPSSNLVDIAAALSESVSHLRLIIARSEWSFAEVGPVFSRFSRMEEMFRRFSLHFGMSRNEESNWRACHTLVLCGSLTTRSSASAKAAAQAAYAGIGKGRMERAASSSIAMHGAILAGVPRGEQNIHLYLCWKPTTGSIVEAAT